MVCPLAQQILSSKFMPGDTIVVDVEAGRLTFTALAEATEV
ncbi:hypothetical protein VSS37_06540 [Candidatus Thiothrix sp. Deng01]|uniref:Uncharacterized protein n=1 Tax=Candidatus Thiothrix phosphatis TaxID=3112415 RepID=A0ABU6CWY7_9GAMM|nr:hypothetical protein [Candidatus Thiothrix sp. Deng01]MEB4590629.1 hypothetical protein [Candidatus Thiothrix sp. Deng01]